MEVACNLECADAMQDTSTNCKSRGCRSEILFEEFENYMHCMTHVKAASQLTFLQLTFLQRTRSSPHWQI